MAGKPANAKAMILGPPKGASKAVSELPGFVFCFPWLDHEGKQIGVLGGCHRRMAPTGLVQQDEESS